MVVPALSLAFGVVCRVVSLALATNGTALLSLAFEIATPHSVAPNGMLFCSSSAAADFETARVVAVAEGGTQFDTSSTHNLAVDSFLAAENVLGFDPVETGVLADFLALDAHYAGSYARERLDDVGAAFPGVVRRRRTLDEGVHDNCILLSAAWAADTRYSVQVAIASNSTPTEPFWVAPVSYSIVGDVPNLAVRGDKLGASCPISVSSAAGTPNCTGGTELSPRNGGECVVCPTETGSNCTSCPSGRLRLKAGLLACGPSIGAESIPALASRLCDLFTAHRLQLLNGTASDAVSVSFTKQLVELGASFIDTHLVEETQSQFFSGRRLIDARRPKDPTRLYGLLPNCAQCKGDGTFIDPRTGQRGTLRDRRFQSIQALQLVGMALAASGQIESCPQLVQDPGSQVDPFAVRRFFWNWREL